MNKSRRMQLKAIACLLGLLLLALLLLGRLLLLFPEKESGEESSEVPDREPVIRDLTNVWVLEVTQEGLKVFEEGEEKFYPFALGETISGAEREQVADVRLSDEAVTQVHIKKEKISGRVLSADEEAIEIEGYGKLPLAPQVRGYRLYGTLVMCGWPDVPIGYAMADFVVEEGRICAILLAREEAMEYIRVLLKTSDYAGLYHEALEISCDGEFCMEYGAGEETVRETYEPGTVCRLDRDSAVFETGRVRIRPLALTGKLKLLNVERSQGVPSYGGSLELTCTENGILAVNEILLEEYLYSVVPSEMPASYPEEALKAQAICARTYAYRNMLRAGYSEYGAHVDDSSGFQVYNNILEQERTTAAVKETYGCLLYAGTDGGLAQTYYYSTSCGVGTDGSVWGTGTEGLEYLKAKSIDREGVALPEGLEEEKNFREFIMKVRKEDYESSESWYRWTYTVDKLEPEHMLSVLQNRYQANPDNILTLNEKGEYVSMPVESLGKILDMEITGRGPGGIARELTIVSEEKTIRVLTEHNIRCILNDGETKVLRQDGSRVSAPSLVPSAFLVLDPVWEDEFVTGYVLSGGGFGHGAGLSQNGARHMAEEGKMAEEILAFFYEGCEVKGGGYALETD